MKTERRPLELNSDFKHALDLIEKTDRSLFLTGRAGTGKSTFLQLFKNTTQKRTVVLAPTGIAALNVGGQTIHSFFGFPPRYINSADIRVSLQRKWFEKIEVMVIDEISMVRADLLDAIDVSLRKHRKADLPFGGVQVVFIGDVFQLPPVISSQEERHLIQSRYASPYFFSAHVMEAVEMEMIELRKVYRQENRHFLRLLDAIRLNQIDWEDLEDINARYMPRFEAPKNWITLSPYNHRVDEINRRQLSNLPLPEHIYTATLTGEFDLRQAPTEVVLSLRRGAQVMFIKNDPGGRFVNGTIGEVIDLEPDKVTVNIEELSDSRQVSVERMSWEIIRYKPSEKDDNELEAEVVGTFTQFPIKLAWAVTIHKAQGKTFDRVVIDMGRGAFEFGQAYVALSRCRSLDGIVLLRKLQPADVKVDERVVDFYERYFLR